MAPPLLEVAWGDSILFSLNGRRVTLRRPRPDMTLIEYLRDVARLTGTKLSCGEGGCGACTVVLCHHPLEHLPLALASPLANSSASDGDGNVVFRAVNACLFPVCALDGVEVFTVEGIGSSINGLHALQQRLADANGTQCGFCTPGWVMNMYELLRKTKNQNKEMGKQEIENHFDGNLCRCTGYRPILEAFHSFASQNEDENDPDHVRLQYEANETNVDAARSSHTCQGGCTPMEANNNSNSLAVGVEAVLSECDHLEDWLLVDSVEEGRRSICEAKCGQDKTHSCETKYPELEELFAGSGGTKLASLAENAPYDTASDLKPSDFIVNFKPRPLKIEQTDTKRIWYRPLNLEQLKVVFMDNCLSTIAFVGGRTAHGVSKYYNNTAPYNRPTETSVQVELNYISEFKVMEIQAQQSRVAVGAAITINTLVAFLKNFTSDEYDTTSFLELSTLFQRVANNQVRNSGTWAGNLSLCQQHPSFVSDIVVGLMGIGATLTLLDEKLERHENVAVDTFLHKPASDFIMIVEMQLPLHPQQQKQKQLQQSGRRQQLSCYKVAQRPQNAHSHVNCAIWTSTHLQQQENGQEQQQHQQTKTTDRVCVDIRIVFGGVCKYPSRFPLTEKFLKGTVMTQQTLQDATKYLENDLTQIGKSDAFGSTPSRISVMKNLLYKALLNGIAEKDLVDPSVASAASKLLRGVSSGTQSFRPRDEISPVSKPIQKISAKMQVTGEAGFTVDKELPASGLYGAILYSRRALATILSIDKSSTTRSLEGVVDIIMASDVRGANDISSGAKEEQLFVPVGGVVRCIGAPIALIVATSPQIAEFAVASCEVEYGAVPADELWHGQSVDTPILDIDMAVKAGTLGVKEPIQMGDDKVDDKLARAKHLLTGNLLLGAQKHFYMEPQVSVVSIQEGGVFEVETSSQYPQFIQQQLASVLNVQHNSINVKVQRIGGGFGGKLTRCVVNAAAAAVAAQKHQVPVRVLNDRSADFRLVGGRENMRGSYKIGFDDDGYIHALDLQLDVDCGYTVGDSAGSATMAVQWGDSAYHASSFRCRAFLYLTNTQTCTSLRAPGVPQSLMLYEAAIHHVAETLNLPMRWIQERNLYREREKTPYGQLLTNVRFHEVWDRLIVASHMEQREEAIEIFNSNNKWKKRGIAITPTKYGMVYSGRKDGSRVEIFAGDGSVILTHSGCEMGQGIHTKAVQVCAYELDIPMSLISVRPTSTDQIPNGDASGGSSTSESVAQSIIACCDTLKQRLEPFRNDVAISKTKVGQPLSAAATWVETVQRAHTAGVCLFTSAQPLKTLPNGDMFDYFVYAAACSEVEIDILTGEINIKSSELVYDCGISLNPAIDIGQIEGGFVMGIGLYLQEDVQYSVPDGELLTQGTWEYKVPCSKDIPEKFRVTLLGNVNNTSGVLNSKATGEPPYALAASVYFAVKKALMDSRCERGVEEFLQLDIPASVMRRQDAAMIQSHDYTL